MNLPGSFRPVGVEELVGDLSGSAATVDRAGTVTPLDAGWRVGWAVGAADRWHIATAEAAVRFRLADDMPVAVTAMRVPGGDVIESVAVVSDGSNRAVTMEFANETSVPVSLALAVMPRYPQYADVDGSRTGPAAETDASAMSAMRDHRPGNARAAWRLSRRKRPHRFPASAWLQRQRPQAAAVKRAEVRGSAVVVDGRVAVELGQPPGGAVAVSDGDPWPAVQAEPPPGDCAVDSRVGCAAAAVVLPLPSGVPRRVSIPIRGGPVLNGTPAEVASGWRSVVARAASFQPGDQAVGGAWRRGIAASILAAGDSDASDAARAAVVLDLVGLDAEADRGRAVVLEAYEHAGLGPVEAVLALRALASRRLRVGRFSGLDTRAGPLVALADNDLDIATVEQVAAALASEAPDAAADAYRLSAELTRTVPTDLPTGSRSRPEAPMCSAITDGAASGAVSTRFGLPGVEGIESILGCLVAESSEHLVVAPALPEQWRGASLDVRSLHTRHGRLSFSIRWHGSRPALLWQLEPTERSDGVAADAVVVRCGLAPAWSSADSAGETLLVDTLRSAGTGGVVGQ